MLGNTRPAVAASQTKESGLGGGGVGVGLSTGCFCVSTVKNMFSSPVQGDNSVAVA